MTTTLEHPATLDRRLNIGFGELTACGRVRSDGSVCGRPSTSGDPCDYCLWCENERTSHLPEVTA
jgi:hypothetical protein